eukprot:12439646-Alexandrium_andersonii.AAC.1
MPQARRKRQSHPRGQGPGSGVLGGRSTPGSRRPLKPELLEGSGGVPLPLLRGVAGAIEAPV